MESISHSGLSRIKTALCRQRLPPAHASFFQAGTLVHERCLENIYNDAPAELLTDVEGMDNALKLSTDFSDLVDGARCEVEVTGKVDNCPMHGIIDILHPNLIGDLKTTSTRTQKEFEKSASKYGYFRQAFVYKTIMHIEDYIIVGVRKNFPYDVFVMNMKDYPKQMAYAKQETLFLLELYRRYPHLAAKV